MPRKAALLLFLALLLAGSVAFAGLGEIKSRMAARLPTITALKNQGVVGENNQGYLEFLGSRKTAADTVAAENRDRRQVYTAIARQQGVSPELVGRLRARQIAERAPRGHWLQDEQGRWYRKK